jgi:hypothetical protein
MFKDSPEGQTHSCPHKKDGTICNECLGIKLILPRKYLSWSQMNCFLTSPARFRKEYFENGPRLTSKYLSFGKKVHELIENNKHKDILPDLVVYDVRELEIRCEVRGVPILAYIDSYDPVNNVFRDTKTGIVPWDKVKVIKLGQLPFYAVALKHKYGKTPEYCHLDWLQSKEGKSDTVVDDFWRTNETELNLTGYMKSFQRDFDEREIEKTEELIVKTAELISEAYQLFLKEI